ncbi:MAG: hypothetical protein ACRENZ_02290 [Thermodesulfobacteriota bacterium]
MKLINVSSIKPSSLLNRQNAMRSFLVLILAISVYSIQFSFADKNIQSIEYFDNRYLLNEYVPIVCFYEPEKNNNGLPNQQLYDATFNAISDWVGALEEASGQQGVWDIGLKVIGNETSYGKPTQWFMRECNINIIFMGAPLLDVDTGGYFKGGARHLRGSTTYSDILIYTWDYFLIDPRTLNMTEMKEKYGDTLTDETRYYEAKPVNEQILRITLEHELGHAFGLKHHLLNGKEGDGYKDYDVEHANMSIMYYLTSRHYDIDGMKKITDFDTMAIMAKYSTDGWGNVTNYGGWQYKTYN